jgi:hypothetical protein
MKIVIGLLVAFGLGYVMGDYEAPTCWEDHGTWKLEVPCE